MKIDVIIPTLRPGKEFAELLQSLESQTQAVHKIVVMNTRAGAFPQELVRVYNNVEVFHLKQSEFDHGRTRNVGVSHTEAEYLLFLTQDALPADRYLVERLVAAFENPRVKAAYARQLPREDCRELERYTRSFNYPKESRVKTKEDLKSLGIKTFFCSNVCAMYERETFLRQGGFVNHTIFNEDMIYAGGLIKSGYGIAYVAEAKVIHSHNYSGRKQFQRNFDLAVSQADHPEIFAGVASEEEGIRLVKKTAAHCLKIGKPWLIFSLVFFSGCKYIGYRLGKNYRKLPKWLIQRCTMNRGYWKQQ
ncbi:MAG: glycosyltransferase family 2 protein [Lachnospiraceae bacterium]|jgi:rhamnosyltransferase|nr:glycosyltransferase family 2 protein [Lachnospiraceae bacterium]